MLAVAIAIVATVFRPIVAFQLFGFSNPRINAELAVLLSLGLCLDASMFLVARSPRISHESALSFALLYQVLRSFSVALNMVRIDGLAGLPPAALTFAFAGLLLFPLIIPMRSRKAFAASLLAAATQPLVLIGFSPVPVPKPIFVHCLIASAATVAFAALCGRLGYSLTARATRGRELGSYHLERCLRRDEAGEVWRAKHRLLARPATVRTLRPWLVDAAACDRALVRFRQEAQIAAKLTSPHTVTLYDFGVSEDGCIYSASELVEGESLACHVRRHGPLSPEKVRQLGLEVCDSVHEAHSMGLLHRALTPDHVSLCRMGRRLDFAKVSGFGRVRFDEMGAVVDAESDTLADFPSPEVSHALRATERSDVFQLGGVLYFALTGSLPSRSGPTRTSAVEQNHAAPALFDIIERCLQEDPSRRFETINEVCSELAHLSVAFGARPQSERVSLSEETGDAAVVDRGEADPSAAPVQLLTVPSKLTTSEADDRSRARRGAASLSADALDVARQRLAQLGVLCAALSSISLFIVLTAERYFESYLPAVVASALFGVGLDLALFGLARAERWPTRTVLRAGIVYFVLRCAIFAFAIANVYLMLGLAPPRITYAAVFLMLMPAFIPGRARTLLLPCLVTVVLYTGILVALHPEGLHVFPVIATYSTLALVASMFTARIMSGLRADASSGPSYGGYRLGTLIARGAMGEVWSAEHELLARPAAVKLIRRTRTSAEHARESRRRFEHEAYVTARLSSPHTVTLYDYGVDREGTYYYVMELLTGEDLQRHVARRGPLPPEETTRLGLQICDSLAEAHARGLVHRDLKPSNLFLAHAGCHSDFIKVLDFGIADLAPRLKSDRAEADGTDMPLAGTPQYMAPEVFLAGTVDARSDLYQIGCVLFFLLTGRVLFERPNLASLALAHVHQEPPKVASLSPHAVPAELERIIARCLEKNPAARYASAEELEADLEQVFGTNQDSGTWLCRPAVEAHQDPSLHP